MKLFSDSRLVVGQVKGELEARDSRMQEYLNQVRHLQSGFETFTLQQTPKSRNMHADSLATLLTSSVQSLPWVILVENLCRPTEMERERNRGGNSCSHVGFVSCQLMSIRLYGSTLTRHIY